MDIRVVVTRAGIFVILYAIVLGIPFYVGYQTKSWALSTTFAVIFATLGPLIYRVLQRKAEDILLAQQRHYQKVLLQAAAGMVREHNLKRLFTLIAYIVRRSVKISYAAIFSYDKSKKSYTLQASRGRKLSTSRVSFAESSRLIGHIKEIPHPFTREEISSSFRSRIEEKLGVTFDLIVPSVIEDRILGFLILGEKLDKSVYSQDDINVFQILSHQAALAIENCVFFDEFKNVQNKIFEAEKLASIGGMADGLAHQIKNRLNHFSIATGELKLELESFMESHPQFAQDPDYKKSFDYMISIVESLLANVKRTDDVIRGILSYARTSEKDSFFDLFSLKEVISLSLELLEIKHQIKEFPLELKLDSVDILYGVKSQIMETMYNLLDNAYEALEEKKTYLADDARESFTPRITVEAKAGPSYTLISISDNGIGIKEDDRLKIFAPFFTTKSSYKPLMPKSKSGTGIGMYVVRRLIEENHEGKIWFDSRYRHGTTFHIRLPLKKSKEAPPAPSP